MAAAESESLLEAASVSKGREDGKDLVVAIKRSEVSSFCAFREVRVCVSVC